VPFSVRVDAQVCEGHGLCLVDTAEVFQPDAEGYATVVLDQVPDALYPRVEASARACPAGAIHVEARPTHAGPSSANRDGAKP
jgi:ferredoxin